MKKVLKRCSALVLLGAVLLTMGGCSRKAGDFKVEKMDEGGYVIVDLSQQGYQKKELFISDEIAGYDIVQIGTGRFDIFSTDTIIDSQNLEKIYFIDYVRYERSIFSECENLKRIIRVDIKSKGIKSLDFRQASGTFVKQYVKQTDYLKFSHIDHVRPANVSYFLNYENAENDGYHWIDDFDYGTKITYIPDDPIREGYAFGGWYKEPECINEWDFETDTLPKAIMEEGAEEPVYQETKLFAKWIRA